MKTLLLVHHSHTDIGYTERQEKLKNYHTDYIEEVIRIINDDYDLLGYSDFKWQCENVWQIDNFLEKANEENIVKFEKYVKSGNIGLSGSYLNLTELVSDSVLRFNLAKSQALSDKLNYEINSSMTADINGYAWGYPDALYDSGIRSLYCALHPHHGMFPLYRKQMPFYWRGPKGNKILTWIGEHYHMGNEMFLCPNAGSSYMHYDDVRDEIEASGGILGKDLQEVYEKEIGYAVRRLNRYVDNLEKEEYPFDFFPLMVSGAITDNAPPNRLILDRISAINKKMKGKLEIRLGTIDDFFELVEKSNYDIPTLQGDFTDWWADGVASTPKSLKLYREAQRKLDLIEKLTYHETVLDEELLAQAKRDLIMYAEHTWGYSSSIIEPWDTLVETLEFKKDFYSIEANNLLSKQLDDVLVDIGEKTRFSKDEPRFKVFNPHPVKFSGIVNLYVEFWEKINGWPITTTGNIAVYDINSGEEFKFNGRRISRAFELDVAITLEPQEERILSIKQNLENPYTIRNHAHIGAEGIEDVVVENKYTVLPSKVETDFFEIEFSRDFGITKLYDKSLNKNLISDKNDLSIFSGFYQITPAGNLAQTEVRRRMGRNRSAFSTENHRASLKDTEIIENDSAFVTVKLTYELEGTEFYFVILKISKTMPLIDAKVCMHKKSIWHPENMFVALPFCLDKDEETFIDKTGCIIRPGIDQLPGTCQEFYLLQNSIIKHSKGQNLIIALKDTPLVVFGNRDYKAIELSNAQNTELNKSTPFSWVMNNFWETNFKADLGGFYEFRYQVYTGFEGSIDNAFRYSESMNQGLLGFNY